MIVTVAGLKGGIGKTTTAANLAHAQYEQLCNVLALDADPQASLRTWAKWGEWVIPVEKFAAGRAAQVRPLGWDVVIDTPPYDAHVTAAAVGVATHVVYPMAPTGMEFEGVDRMRALLDRYAPQAHRLILLNRTVARASSTTEYRAALEAEGWHVARATVGRREQFAQSYGAIPFRASSTAFGDCLADLRSLEVSA